MKPVMSFLAFLTFGFLVFPTALLPAESAPLHPARSVQYQDFWPSSQCKDCHTHIYEQHSLSMHAKSFTNPVFQAQYFLEVLPKIGDNAATLSRDAENCIACHSPISYIHKKGAILTEEEVDPLMAGVTCDLCHTIIGYDGEKPESGNYITQPGIRKFGPFKTESNWHHIYSELHTKSEFCAICHNAVNHNGLEIKSTFSEWQQSPYARLGIQCQDCHMNVDGFLTKGKARYESGKAARTSLVRPPERIKLYTHRFPGARTNSQIIGALTLDITIREDPVAPGDTITIDVLVDNSKTGHKMPSGSADLRLLVLDLQVHRGTEKFHVSAARSMIGGGFDVSGKGRFDSEILGKNFPAGRRIYRAIFVDAKKQQTLASYDAVKIIFDNRLDPAEIRAETYRMTVPAKGGRNLLLMASLSYYPYPAAFSRKLHIPEPQPVIVATAEKRLELQP